MNLSFFQEFIKILMKKGNLEYFHSLHIHLSFIIYALYIYKINVLIFFLKFTKFLKLK